MVKMNPGFHTRPLVPCLIHHKKIWSYYSELKPHVYLHLSYSEQCLSVKTVHEASVMDISAEIPLHAFTQEDTLSLWFKVLPMKLSCRGQAPSFWHHYILACPEQKGLRVVMPASESLTRGGTAEDARLFSHVSRSQWKHWKTARSHQLSLMTQRPQEKRE